MKTHGAHRLLKALAALDEKADQSAAKERRVHTRHRVRGQGSLIFDPLTEVSVDRTGQLVHIRDVSRGGFGILCSERVEIGRASRLVCATEGVELCSALVVPTHLAEVLEGVYLVGCMLVMEASVLLALGVTPHELALAEERPLAKPTDGDFGSVDGSN